MTGRLTIHAVRAAAVFTALLLAGGCTISRDDGSGWYGDEGPFYPDAGDGPVQGTPDAGNEWWVDAAPLPDGGWTVPDAQPVPHDGGSVDDAAPNDGGSDCSCGGQAPEAVCIVTPGCSPLYRGEDCACYDDGTCTCATMVYDRCE